MIKHLSMKPTGWFQIAWSDDIAPGGVKPMTYFGHELVAFRNSAGKLSIFDAHCPHMGAHLGHGGKVKNDCLTCPYHGWQFDSEGTNTLIPYEDYTINKKLKKWDIVEQHDAVFLWHDPNGGPPREGWLPHLFDYDEMPADINDFYPAYKIYMPNERIHPQLVNENSADTAHFKYTHGVPVDPKLLHFDTSTPIWKSAAGFISPKTGEVSMTVYPRNPGVGLSFTIFVHHGGKGAQEGAYGLDRRLLLSTTPVDDEKSDLRLTYYFPKEPKSPDVMPEYVKDIARSAEVIFQQDINIWRHMKFIQRPLFAKQDVEPYTALRKWSNQFYELEGAPVGPLEVIEE